MIYKKILLESIENEKAGIEYCYSNDDREILHEMFREINEERGISIRYLAEVDAFNIHGTGEIMARYITKFSSDSVRSMLIPQLVSDKIKDCDKLLLRLYLNFKESDEYISLPGVPSPAHITVRYDNAFKALKPKRLKEDLVKLAYSPRDVHYLPFTMRMLASWKVPELKDLFIGYSSDSNISVQDVGINENDEYYPPFGVIKRDLRFTAINALKYYPSDDTIEIIRKYVDNSDPNISAAARRTLKVIAKEQP